MSLFRVTAFVSALALLGCGGSTSEAGSASAPAMSPAEARSFILEVQKERGVAPDRTPVTSVDELLEVLARDDVPRFEAATQLVSGKPGIDALSLNATIELCWSDSLSTLALVFEELRKRDDAEVERLTQERDGG